MYLTRLGKLARAHTHEDILQLADAYSLRENQFYFDRDAVVFNCLLNFYRTDRLHVIDEICILDYQDDLDYWNVTDINLEVCCFDKFNSRRDHILGEVEKDKQVGAAEEEVAEDFGNGYFAKYQKALWDLFEKPQSSLAAKFVSLFSISLVMISTAGMCFNTFPWMLVEDIHGEPVDNPKLALVEAICISYFSLEYLLRFAGSPKKIVFLKNTMNIIDCMAIAPYYLTLFLVPPPEMTRADPLPVGNILTTTTLPTILDSTPVPEEEESGFGNVGRVMQVFRIARIMRIFKLARRSVGLQSIAHTVKTSYTDLGLLFMLVGMGMLVWGSLLYYIESGEEDTGFYSIPQGMWWAVQTLTSLGYGDFGVETIIGKLVGSCTAVCGVLVMALPIPIVVDNFADYYKEQKLLEIKELKMEAQEKQDKMDARAAKVGRQ